MLKPKPLSLTEKYHISRTGALETEMAQIDTETMYPGKPFLPCKYADHAVAWHLLMKRYPEEAFEFRYGGVFIRPYYRVKKPWPWQKAPPTSGPVYARAAAREDAAIEAAVAAIDDKDEARALEGGCILVAPEYLDPTKTIKSLQRRYPRDQFKLRSRNPNEYCIRGLEGR